MLHQHIRTIIQSVNYLTVANAKIIKIHLRDNPYGIDIGDKWDCLKILQKSKISKRKCFVGDRGQRKMV